jgi:hypothetical protein
VELRWSSQAACPAPEQPEREIARLLGQRYAAVPPTAFEVEVTAQGERAYELSLRPGDAGPDQARTLKLSSCAEVTEAAILLAAMALDPELEPPASPPARTDQPADSQPAPEPAAAAPTRAPGRLRLELAGILDFWALPAVSGGPSLGLSTTHEKSWQFAAYARYLAPRSVAVDSPLFARAPEGALRQPGQARIGLFAFALEVGYRFQLHRWQLGPDAELELGGLYGRVTGLPEGSSGTTLWASLWGGTTAAVELHPRVALVMRALLGAPLRRPRFALEGEPAFYTTAPATLRLSIGVSIALGTTD